MKINRDKLNLNWFLCLLLRRHKWGYLEAGGKPNHNCQCDMDGCCFIPIYNLVCERCGCGVTLGEDELIDCFAKKLYI